MDGSHGYPEMLSIDHHIDSSHGCSEMLLINDNVDNSSIKHSKFQLVLDEIKRRQLQFNGTPLDLELIQEASRQKLRRDELDRVFDDPIIQLKVRGILGPDFCDYIGISHAANARDNDITIGLNKVPGNDTRCVISDIASQKRAFRDCVLKIIGSK